MFKTVIRSFSVPFDRSGSKNKLTIGVNLTISSPINSMFLFSIILKSKALKGLKIQAQTATDSYFFVNIWATLFKYWLGYAISDFERIF